MISVVVCTYNGSSRISACLSSLIGQVSPPTFEILVVDNASDDGTEDQVVNRLSSSFFSGQWKVIREQKVGLVHARLAGLKEAKFGWVMFCDDDNVLAPDFLQKAQETIGSDSRLGVLGSLGIPEFMGPKPVWFDRYASSFAVGPQLVSQFGAPILAHVYGACSIYRRDPLMNLFTNGFRSVLSDRSGESLSSGGDVEWCWLMQLMGYQVAYSSKLMFTHQLPASRLTWEYYLRLKRGISSNAGILSTYTYFYRYHSPSVLRFVIHYFIKTFRTILIYLKYKIKWKGNPSTPQDQLSYCILQAQMNAFLNQFGVAILHFKKLKKYFGK